MQMKRRKSHAVWTTLIAVAALLLFLPLSILLTTIFMETFSPEVVEAEVESYKWIEEYGGRFFRENIVMHLASLFRTMIGGG